MSWLSWLLLLAALYVLVIVVRGIIEFASWFAEEYLGGRRERRRRQEEPAEAPHQPKPREAVRRQETAAGHASDRKMTCSLPVQTAARARKRSRRATLLQRMKVFLGRKGYDYWVGCALSEEDPNRKIEYLSKALQLNPTYLPAWGLKANALLDRRRFQEAIDCFDKFLAACPSPLGWYKKGLCCQRLSRREEAIECFHKAMQACQDKDRQLWEDAARMKRAVESE